MMKEFVAITVDNKTEVHAGEMGVGGGYDSLCGIDANDPSLGHYLADLPPNPKINCPDCISIIKAAKAFKKSDIQAKAEE